MFDHNAEQFEQSHTNEPPNTDSAMSSRMRLDFPSPFQIPHLVPYTFGLIVTLFLSFFVANTGSAGDFEKKWSEFVKDVEARSYQDNNRLVAELPAPFDVILNQFNQEFSDILILDGHDGFFDALIDFFIRKIAASDREQSEQRDILHMLMISNQLSQHTHLGLAISLLICEDNPVASMLLFLNHSSMPKSVQDQIPANYLKRLLKNYPSEVNARLNLFGVERENLWLVLQQIMFRTSKMDWKPIRSKLAEWILYGDLSPAADASLDLRNKNKSKRKAARLFKNRISEMHKNFILETWDLSSLSRVAELVLLMRYLNTANQSHFDPGLIPDIPDHLFTEALFSLVLSEFDLDENQLYSGGSYGLWRQFRKILPSSILGGTPAGTLSAALSPSGNSNAVFHTELHDDYFRLSRRIAQFYGFGSGKNYISLRKSCEKMIFELSPRAPSKKLMYLLYIRLWAITYAYPVHAARSEYFTVEADEMDDVSSHLSQMDEVSRDLTEQILETESFITAPSPSLYSPTLRQGLIPRVVGDCLFAFFRAKIWVLDKVFPPKD